MCNKNWRLGDDLYTDDNLLDGFTFYDIILQVHHNCRNITQEAVMGEIRYLVNSRLDDMYELLARNMDVIMAEARKGR